MEKFPQNLVKLSPEVEHLLLGSIQDGKPNEPVTVESFSARIHQAALVSSSGRVWPAKDTLACIGEILQRVDVLRKIPSRSAPRPKTALQPAPSPRPASLVQPQTVPSSGWEMPPDGSFLKGMSLPQISDFINVIDSKTLRISLNDILGEFASGKPHNDFAWLQNMFVSCKKRRKELQEMHVKAAKKLIESLKVYKMLDYQYTELKKEATRLEATGVKKMLYTHSFFGRIGLWLRTGRNANDQKLLAISWTNLQEDLQAAERERLAMNEAILVLEGKREKIGREAEDAKNKLDLIAQFGEKIAEQNFTPLE